MKILLDTHIFLWFISGDKRLLNHWKTTIQKTNNNDESVDWIKA